MTDSKKRKLDSQIELDSGMDSETQPITQSEMPFTSQLSNAEQDIPIASLLKAPKKASVYFNVEINLRNYAIHLDKSALFNDICRTITGVECIVSLEIEPASKTKYRSDMTFKMFIDTSQTRKKYLSNDIYRIVNEIVRDIVGQEQQISPSDLNNLKLNLDKDKRPEIIISKPNSRREAIRWATIDFEPRFTTCFDPNDFSESYKREHYVRAHANEKFSLKMLYVRAPGRQSIRELKSYFEEHQAENYVKYKFKKCMLGPYADWREPVRLWWNDWIDKGWSWKKKQMLIVGKKANTGKTLFVTSALFGKANPENLRGQ